MHPDADAFLDAIFATPDDDTPRLVYADWLAEHGQEHYAQFIRLQCAAARYRLWSDEANRLWEEIGRVWPRLADEWWPATSDVWWLDATDFHRGFLRHDIELTTDELLRYEHCWPWLPTPETVLSVTAGCDLVAVAALPVLCRIRYLQCGGDWSFRTAPTERGGLDELLCSPQLCSLTHLDLLGHRLSQSNLNALLTAPNLASVTNLKVTLNEQDWLNLAGGCLPDQHEAAHKLKDRFPNVYCDFR